MAQSPRLSVVPAVSFGQRLRSERLARGQTQAQLAAAMDGVRQQTVGAWESDSVRPQPRFFPSLVAYLRLDGEEDLRRLLEHETRHSTSGGPRSPRASASSAGTAADEPTLQLIAEGFCERLKTGPPLSRDEAMALRDLISAVQTRQRMDLSELT